jgi:glutamyl-tRNA reductase
LTTGTIGTLLAAGSFIALMSGFISRTKVWLSKLRAERKMKALEAKAEEAMREDMRTLSAQLDKREVEWEVIEDILED